MNSAPESASAVIKIVPSIAEIGRAAWDACANPGAVGPGSVSGRTGYNPFVSWDFLEALERSGSVSARTGWTPRHFVLTERGDVAAVMPCYAKSHSQGEYVFDWGWADAFERAGGRYYPKLQVSVPFTPVPGPRLLAPPGPNATTRKGQLAAGLIELCRRTGISSAHLTFLPEEDCEQLGEMGFLTRMDQQFHWTDEGYGDFDGFLGALASRKRKAIRKERQEAMTGGVSIEWLTGGAITEAHWDSFFSFYMDTGSRKWGQPYLNRRFFSLLGERMADRVLLIMARRGGAYIGGALNLIGSDTLYGRHWGSIEERPYLHFEVCYYQAIEFALARGLSRVEAGAQGAHKLSRGYLPAATWSAHYIADPNFRRAVASYLEEERREVARQGKHSPTTPHSGAQNSANAKAQAEQAAGGRMNEQDYDDNNVFARILRGELPSERVYEDAHAIAIMDVMPQGRGHTLVIPKVPSRNLLDIGEADLKNVMPAVQTVARAVKKAFDAPGLVVTQFNEAAGGQTVFHTHFHVIPRFDGVPLKPHTGEMADAAMLKADAEKIRAALRR